jgi:hypothetical protein
MGRKNEVLKMTKNVYLNNLPFTYYGDLLGVSDSYKIHENAGHDILSEFYASTYRAFQGFENNVKITLISDSVFIRGKRLKDTVKIISNLYIELLKKHIYLKGVIVEGFLEFEPRVEYENIQKMLPNSNVLYRAVVLEKKAEGIRLIFEKKLAQKIIPQKLYGPFFNFMDPDVIEILTNDPERELLKNFKWNPNINAYDYFWFNHRDDNTNLSKIIELIKIGKNFANKKAQKHYTETLNLVRQGNFIFDLDAVHSGR